jgi:hypothetical protein
MRRALSFCFVIVALLLSVVSADGLAVGESPEQVRAQLGEPNGVRQLAGGEVWVYSGDITLEFTAGKLVRARGLMLEPEAEVPEAPLDEGDIAATIDSIETAAPPTDGTERVLNSETIPEEIRELRESEAERMALELEANANEFKEAGRSLANAEAGEMDEYDADSGDGDLMPLLWNWIGLVVMQFIFLAIACRVVGAEASLLALFFIALVDKLVIESTIWLFTGLLEMPMTFHAESLASFIVMISMVTKLTHARSLPTAIKVVVGAKVAAMITGYVVLLLVLHNL